MPPLTVQGLQASLAPSGIQILLGVAMVRLPQLLSAMRSFSNKIAEHQSKLKAALTAGDAALAAKYQKELAIVLEELARRGLIDLP